MIRTLHQKSASRRNWNVGLVIIGILLGVAVTTVGWSHARRRVSIAQRIEAAGGTVSYWWGGPVFVQNLAAKSGMFESLGYAHVSFVDTAKMTPVQLERVVADVAELSGIEILMLAGESVDDSWLEAFGRGPTIPVLLLEKTNISDVGLECLLRWTNLEVVKLQGNSGVTRATVERIARMKPGLHFSSDLP
jgi:hypothetical protein